MCCRLHNIFCTPFVSFAQSAQFSVLSGLTRAFVTIAQKQTNLVKYAPYFPLQVQFKHTRVYYDIIRMFN